MAVLCPRCGENSEVLEEHCKKCGFSIKNYIDNQKRYNMTYKQDSIKNNKKEDIENTTNVSSSICVMEEQKESSNLVTIKESVDSDIDSNVEDMETTDIFEEKSDEIQENILRILGNIKIVPDTEAELKNEHNDNKIIEKNVQDVLEEIIHDNYDKDDLDEVSSSKKKDAVKIIAKKVANDVIILPPSRVKVEIEAAKEVVREEKAEDVKSEDINNNEENDNKLEQEKNDEVQIKEEIEFKEEIKTEEEIESKEEIKTEEEIESKEEIKTEEEIKHKEEITDEVIENKIKEIKSGLATKKDDLVKKAENIKEVFEPKDVEEIEIVNGALNYVQGNKFQEFISRMRSEDDGVEKVIAVVSLFILILVVIIMFITSTATASQLLGIVVRLLIK